MSNISFMMQSFSGGGTERVIMNLAKPLTEFGHRIFVFVNELHSDKMPDEDLPITYIMLPRFIYRSANYPVILEAVKQHNIEVFFAPISYPKYLNKLKDTNLCKIVHILHGAPFYEKCMEEAAITKPQTHSIGSFIKHNLIRVPMYKLGLYNHKLLKEYRKIYNSADIYGVLFDSYGRELADALKLDYESSHICTLQNPIPEIEYDICDCRREKRIVVVSRFSYWDKRLDRMLKVWDLIHERFPDWKLSFVGDGPEANNLQNMVADLHLQRVEFLGFHPNPTIFYKTSEILCMTSMIEGCPMVLLEAQANGCACMAFDCSAGVREILSPIWENGAYAPNGDIKAYAETLSRLMSDDELRAKIQRNGLENVKRFSVEKSAKQYHDLIEKLLSKSTTI